MASAPSASWNSRCITHLANCPNRSLPTNSSDESPEETGCLAACLGHMSLLLRLSSLTALIVLLGFTAEPQGDKSIRIQIITGGHPHEISFYDVFQADTDFDITVNPHPSAYQ